MVFYFSKTGKLPPRAELTVLADPFNILRASNAARVRWAKARARIEDRRVEKEIEEAPPKFKPKVCKSCGHPLEPVLVKS